MREQRALTSSHHFFTTARSDEEGRLFMQLANSRSNCQRPINQGRPLSRWDWPGPPMPRGFKAEELGPMAGNLSLRGASEGNTHVRAAAFAPCTTIQH